MMVKLVFARHGQSEWNKANLFTGWADVDLSEKGIQQAIDAGKLIKEVAGVLGGGGGGKPQMAQAGGKDISSIPQAMEKAKELIQAQLQG